jgi:hypothetical protein
MLGVRAFQPPCFLFFAERVRRCLAQTRRGLTGLSFVFDMLTQTIGWFGLTANSRALRSRFFLACSEMENRGGRLTWDNSQTYLDNIPKSGFGRSVNLNFELDRDFDIGFEPDW